MTRKVSKLEVLDIFFVIVEHSVLDNSREGRLVVTRLLYLPPVLLSISWGHMGLVLQMQEGCRFYHKLYR